MPAVTVDTKDLELVLSRMGSRSQNLASVNRRLASDLLVAVEDEFDTEGHGKWAKLKVSTLERSPRRRGGKLLQDTGVLVNSLTPFSGPDFIEVFTNNPYAKFHTSSNPRRVIPKRDFTDLSNIERVLEDMAQELMMEITK